MNLGNRFAQHSFAQTPDVHTTRSAFDRSFATKTTFNFDDLTPLFVEEILPGDTLNVNVRSFARLAPQVVPLMDNMYIDFFFHFVPARLVYDNWEKLMGARENPGDSIDYLVPQIQSISPGFANMSIYDQMGIPTQVHPIQINALPLRAYNLIWNTWFRDENLQNSVPVLKGDGPDLASTYTLLKRGKRHDYFTSALPWPQKGSPVGLPLTNAPVVKFTEGPNSTATQIIRNRTTQDPYGTTQLGSSGGGTFRDNVNTANQLQLDLNNTHYADLNDVQLTMNMFRQAIMLQSLLELDARGGTRYVELLRSHFNVISPDFRLQIPELLSTGRTQIQQHVVAQTSETANTPQGNLAAFSTAATGGSQVGFAKSFVEHGYIIAQMCARADITYQQGLNKLWSRRTRYDFFWPKFTELGEQAILRKEIFITGTEDDNLVFGYQERYGEYRNRLSEIKGQFRSNFAESLDVWHLSEFFETAPVLNATFIEQSTPIERSLVVPDEGYPHLLFDGWIQMKHVRPMPTHSIPATLGRF